jgi:hypothetical protein
MGDEPKSIDHLITCLQHCHGNLGISDEVSRRLNELISAGCAGIS